MMEFCKSPDRKNSKPAAASEQVHYFFIFCVFVITIISCNSTYVGTASMESVTVTWKK